MSSRLRFREWFSLQAPTKTIQLQLTASNCAHKKRINNKNPNLYGKHYSIVGRNYEWLEFWAGSRRRRGHGGRLRRRGRRGILLLHEKEADDKGNF